MRSHYPHPPDSPVVKFISVRKQILLAKEIQITEAIEAPTTMIVDRSFMVELLKPGTNKDFCEYADNVMVPFVNNILLLLRKHDEIFDQNNYPH